MAEDRAQRVIIVGGGVAGGACAAALREFGFAGEIVLSCAEASLPYDRPPLSKEYLIEGRNAGLIPIHPAVWYREAAIDVRLRASVIAVRPDTKLVEFAGGVDLAYDHLVLATGALPRCPVTAYGSIMTTLSTAEDAARVEAMLGRGGRIVIVGGGLIGLEAAAAARQRGCEVLLVEAADRLMPRVATPAISKALARLHHGQGVDLRVATSAKDAPQADQIMLSDGSSHDVDLVICAIGIEPRLELARDAGLAVDDGILADRTGRTSDPAIYAIGDVACSFNLALRRQSRQQNWESARTQARVAASAICGRPAALDEQPWAWSWQFGQYLQFVGAPLAVDEIVTRGDPGGNEFIDFQLYQGRLVGAVAFNRTRDMVMARRLLDRGGQVAHRLLGDETVPLRGMLEAA